MENVRPLALTAGQGKRLAEIVAVMHDAEILAAERALPEADARAIRIELAMELYRLSHREIDGEFPGRPDESEPATEIPGHGGTCQPTNGHTGRTWIATCLRCSRATGVIGQGLPGPVYCASCAEDLDPA